MALLTEATRKKYFEALGLGEYNEDNIRALQKKYLRKKDVDGIYGTDTDRLLRHVYNVKTYTKNFEPEEFKCECGGKYCTGYPSYMKKVELKNLQSIRNHWNKPMIVTSGLRCKTLNNKLGGSITNSLHLSGYACDFNMDGVTESTAQRKAAIKWIKKLPNHHYTYGHGYNSNGVAVSATYMGVGNGAALHTDTSKPKATAKTSGQKLAEKGWAYAYHTNSSKAKYPSGTAKAAYKAALDTAFGKNRGWSKPAKLGASCDVFIATCIRMAGIDKSIPRGLGRSKFKSSKWTKITSPKVSNVKNGDIISIEWSNGNPHWGMVYNGKVLEASYKGFYPKTTNTLKSRLSKSGKNSVVVYRAK